MNRLPLALTVMFLALALVVFTNPRPATAGDLNGVDSEVRAALNTLYRTTPTAKVLGEKAEGILVFPQIVKAGLIVGAQYGKGALIRKGRIVGHYQIAAGSYGLQAGVQSFGYAMFFMTHASLDYLDKSGGFEVGVGPSIVVVDAGMARAITTTTLRNNIYAFVFGQKGLMAGVGLQGSKISRIRP